MASRIKGITVEIGGDTTGLDKALKDVNKSINKTQSALNDVNRLLKLDPANVELVEQKQKLLTKAISDTKKKLEALEGAQEEVTKAFESGTLGEDKYLAFKREVEATKKKLQLYETELSTLNTEQDTLATSTSRLKKLFDATGTEVDDYADVLGTKLAKAIKDGSADADTIKLALNKIGKAATDGKGDIKDLINALDKVDDGEAVSNLIKEIKNIGTEADTTTDNIGDIAEVTKGQAFLEAAEALSNVTSKIQEIGQGAYDAYMEAENAVTKVNAYFGETGEEADKSAQVINDIYTSGVGDSMDSVANAVLNVKKNLGDLSDEDLTNLTQQAITLDEVYGIDMNETLRGVNSLMNQYGLTAQEAMDYIVAGTQNGLDKTNELGDNLAEYSGKFAQAGYSADEYFQLLNNGLDGGAYNLDKVNDAINEVTTRLADGTIGESIGSYSKQTQKLFKAWQNGEATQKQVIDSIVSDIAGCESQQDALNLAAVAFGTMAEDGNLKFITSLTSVGSTYEDVSGKAQGMFDATTTPMQQMESNTRLLQQALLPLGEKIAELANTIIPPLVTVLETIGGWFGSLPEPVQDFVVVLGGLLVVFTALVPVIVAITMAVTALEVSILPIIAVIVGVAAAIAAVIAIGKLLYENWDTIKAKAIELKDKIVESWNAFKEKVAEIWNGIKQKISDVWNGIKTTIGGIASGVVNTVTTGWNNIINATSTAWSTIKQSVANHGGGIKGVIGTAVDGIKSLWSAGFNVINNLTGGKLGEAFNKVKEILTNIKNAFSEKLEAAKTVVGNVIDGIKKFFSFDWSLPKLKMPHLTIDGEFSLLPPSVPSFSIEWYKKAMDQAYMLNGASIFGSMNGKLLGGGEKGSEMVVGTNYLMDTIQKATAQNDALMVNAFDVMTSRIIDIMSEYFPQFANTQMVMDTGALVGVLAPEVDARLGQIAGFKERRI